MQGWFRRALILLVFLTAGGGWCADYLPFSPPSNTPPATPEQQRAYELRSMIDNLNIAQFPEPKGLDFGKLKLNPFFTLDEVHTDNSRRTPTRQFTDDILSYDVGFTSQFRPMETVKAVLNYDFGWHDYLRGTLRDYLSHQANCEVTVDRVGVEGLSLVFSDQYLLTGNSSALENEIVQFEKYHTNRTEMRAIYKYNRFRITGAYSYGFLDYAASDFSFFDLRTHGGLLDVAWQWIPNRLEIFSSYQIGRTLYDHAREDDFDTNTFLSGVRGKYSKLNYAFGTGYVFSRPVFGVGVKGDIGFNGNVSYSPHSRITVELAGTRAFQAGARTGSALVNDVSAQFKLMLTRKGTFFTQYTFNDSDRFDGVRQNSQAWATRFEYKLLRRAVITAGFTRYERSSTNKIDEFKIDEVKLNMKLSW